MAFLVGVGHGTGVVPARRRPIVCKRKEKPNKGKSKKKGGRFSPAGAGPSSSAARAEKSTSRVEETGGSNSTLPSATARQGPVVSTEGLTERIDLSKTVSFSAEGQSGGGKRKFDDEEWVEWDREAVGEWEQPKGFFDFLNSLPPEILRLDFPSFAEAFKLIVVIIALFFIIASFTYTVDGFYLAIARNFFGADFFFH
ncbi:hypothetical protein NDN08_001435 [Rhodosorus marinus]|uniref:Uncharacterized protein n=1 Tax=Rhodosorus marinus TaxID=101924 RepID=A0AAV8UTU1_9RHOD|nr:hypothetical protein NDN08_001435 [Rhodosorus marinus]